LWYCGCATIIDYGEKTEPWSALHNAAGALNGKPIGRLTVNRNHRLYYFILLSAMFLTSAPHCLSQPMEADLAKAVEMKEPDSSKLKTEAIGQFYAGTLLKGSVELRVDLPQVPNSLLAGNRYPTDLISGLQRTDNWYRVPKWLAGSWRSDIWVKDGGQIIFKPSATRTGAERDSEGQVWGDLLLPYDASPLDKTIKRICDYVEQFPVSDELFVSHAHCISSVTDENGFITRTWQEENLTSYSPNKDGTINYVNKVRLFDQNGKRSVEFVETSQLRLVQAFVPSADKFIQESFKMHLTKIGMSQFIPTDLMLSQPQ